MSRITLKDLKEKIESIENQINTAEFQENKQKFIDAATEIEKIKDNAVSINQDLTTQKSEFDTTKKTIDEMLPEIEENKSKLSELISGAEDLQNESKELNEETRKQLGLVNAESLANTFGEMAGKHYKSYGQWFWWIFGASAILMMAVLLIVYWQFERSGTLQDLGFVTKLTILVPLVIFLSFAMRQFSRDRRLYDEYSFKSAVARSFEAYRKIMKEEKVNDLNHDSKILDFVIRCIGDVYSSPTLAINNKQEDGSVGIKEVSIIQQIMNMFKGK